MPLNDRQIKNAKPAETGKKTKLFDGGGLYSGLNLNQDKATKPQTVQIVRQGEATPYWFKFNPLYLEVTPAGGKIFRLKYRIDGKEKTFTIGKYPTVSLVEARQAAENVRRLLVSGQDPSEAKQQEKRERQAAALNTFESIARRWHIDNLHRWKKTTPPVLFSTLKRCFPYCPLS